MLKIWGRRNSINVQKVMWAVGELGLPHEHIDAGGPFGGLDTEEFGALNPNRRVPVIDDVAAWMKNPTAPLPSGADKAAQEWMAEKK